jgi:type I restriction enzyme S subunit
MKPLGEIVTILKGSKAPEVFDEPKPGAYPYLQIEDLRPDATSKYAIDKDGTLAKKTDVLIAWDGANAGTVGFDLEGYIGSTIAILRPMRNDIHAPYLGYFLRSKFNEIQENATGATIPHVNRGYLENLKLPILPPTEQKRIASLLARADHLRRLRRVGNTLSSSLLQSVFLEMFGDALNGKNTDIPLVSLESLCTKITDGTHVTPNYLESGVPYLSVKNITHKLGTLDFTDIKYISREEHKKISKLANVERDDILYTKVGATYGYAQIVDTDREFSIFVSVALLKPGKTKVLPKFLETVMNSPFVKRQADNLVSGIGVPDLHLREIKTFQIPLPRLPEQERFAAVVRRVESLRRRQAESARQGEGLFQSLLAQSFETA